MKSDQSMIINDENDGVMAAHLDVDPQVCTVIADVGDTEIDIMATTPAVTPHGVDTAMCTLAAEAAKYAVTERRTTECAYPIRRRRPGPRHSATSCEGRDVMPAPIRRTTCYLAALLAAVLASAACTYSHPATPQNAAPSSRTSSAATPAPPDQNLRDVTKAVLYHDGIAHVLPETSAQMICGALTPAEWSQTLGGPVGRTVFGGVDASCVVDTGSLSVHLRMVVDDLGTHGERINGRRVNIGPRNASAAVVAAGEQDIPAQQRISAQPVLYVQTRLPALQEPIQDLPVLLRRLLTVLLPRLARAGKPATPVTDAAGTLVYTPADPVAGVAIHDVPRTVQSRVLCTAVLRVSGITPTVADILVNAVGECVIYKYRIVAKIDQFEPPIGASSPYTVAGYPAFEHPGTSIVINLLTTRPEYGSARAITLRLERDLPRVELRQWAEKVAQAVLIG